MNIFSKLVDNGKNIRHFGNKNNFASAHKMAKNYCMLYIFSRMCKFDEKIQHYEN